MRDGAHDGTAGTVTSAVTELHRACAGVAALDHHVLSVPELADLVIGVARLQDRLRAVNALHLVHAGIAGATTSSGSKTLPGWFADRTGVGYGDAVRMVALGDVLERSARLANAVLSGRFTAAAAEKLHSAIVHGPAGADLDELLDALLGPRPTTEPEPAAGPGCPDDSDDLTIPDDPDADDEPVADANTDPFPADEAPESGLPFGDAPTSSAGAGAGAGSTGPSPKEAQDAANTFNRLNRPNEDPIERARKRRGLSFGPAVDGLVDVRGKLPVLDARIVQNALDHIGGKPDGDDRTAEQRRADSLVMLAQAYANGEVAGGRERPQVIVTVDAASFLGLDSRDAITAHGDRLPPEVARRLAEHAELTWILHTGMEILAQGRNYRYATDAQWKALVARDGGCRWPGCTIRATWCEADHIIDWDTGGPTNIDLLELLCPYHHHLRHQPGARLHGNAHDLTLERPDGTIVPLKPKGVMVGGSSPARPGPPRSDAPDEPTGSTKTSDDAPMTLFATG